MDPRLQKLLSHESLKDVPLNIKGQCAVHIFNSFYRNETYIIYNIVYIWSDEEFISKLKSILSIVKGQYIFDDLIIRIYTQNPTEVTVNVNYHILSKRFNYCGFDISLDDIKTKTLRLTNRNINQLCYATTNDSSPRKSFRELFFRDGWNLKLDDNNIEIEGYNCKLGLLPDLKEEWVFKIVPSAESEPKQLTLDQLLPSLQSTPTPIPIPTPTTNPSVDINISKSNDKFNVSMNVISESTNISSTIIADDKDDILFLVENLLCYIEDIFNINLNYVSGSSKQSLIGEGNDKIVTQFIKNVVKF